MTVRATAITTIHPPSDPQRFGRWAAGCLASLVTLLDTLSAANRFREERSSMGAVLLMVLALVG